MGVPPPPQSQVIQVKPLPTPCRSLSQDFDEGMGRFDESDVSIGEAMQIDPQAKDVQTARQTELQEYESFEAAWDEVKGSNSKTTFFYDQDTGAKKAFYQEWEASQLKSTTELFSLTQLDSTRLDVTRLDL